MYNQTKYGFALLKILPFHQAVGHFSIMKLSRNIEDTTTFNCSLIPDPMLCLHRQVQGQIVTWCCVCDVTIHNKQPACDVIKHNKQNVKTQHIRHQCRQRWVTWTKWAKLSLRGARQLYVAELVRYNFHIHIETHFIRIRQHFEMDHMNCRKISAGVHGARASTGQRSMVDNLVW